MRPKRNFRSNFAPTRGHYVMYPTVPRLLPRSLPFRSNHSTFTHKISPKGYNNLNLPTQGVRAAIEPSVLLQDHSDLQK